MTDRVAGHNSQPAYSLSSLPGPAIAAIFQQLYTTPQAAVNLSQACCICALEDAAERSAFIKQQCCDLRPLYSLSISNQQIAAVTLGWGDPTALKQLYILSSVPEAMNNMWDVLFEEIAEDAVKHVYQNLVGLHNIPINLMITKPVSLERTDRMVRCARARHRQLPQKTKINPVPNKIRITLSASLSLVLWNLQ